MGAVCILVLVSCSKDQLKVWGQFSIFGQNGRVRNDSQRFISGCAASPISGVITVSVVVACLYKFEQQLWARATPTQHALGPTNAVGRRHTTYSIIQGTVTAGVSEPYELK